METPKHYQEENKQENTFPLIDGMVTVLDEEEETFQNDEKENENEEADSSHYSVGGDNGL